MSFRLLLLAALAVAAPACTGEPVPTRTEEQALALAETAAGRLKGVLFTEMSRAIQAGEPADAVEVCGGAAQKLSREVEQSAGFPVRRTALKFRNPKNAPDDFERRWMETVAQSRAGDPADPFWEVQEGKNGQELRYLDPLYVHTICLNCHGGAEVSDGVESYLQEHYPEDRARGFSAGDFRGVVTVRVPFQAPE
ncbi:MAG: DUF3365 domain-containing protein [Planctomycetota bacterium]|nr:MAG: DUF3365 domain-containing protein [Planctomycetota bacterium]